MPLMPLNAAQRQVVQAEAPRLRVLAGAGSGKTLALTERAAALIRARPDGGLILCTFTQRAAAELSTRLLDRLGARALPPPVRVGTFHALARREIGPQLQHLGYGPKPALLDEAAQLKLIAGICGRQLRPKALCSLRAEAIRADLAPAALAEARGLPPEAAEAALASYEAEKRARDAMDFDDLLLAWRDLLAPGSPAREALCAGVQTLLVDEYQDLSQPQIDITEALASAGAQLTVVGDPAQSIYGFRGAAADNLDRFAARAPTQTIRLRESYRSSPQILRAAALLFPPRSRPALAARTPAGPKPALLRAQSPAAEAAAVIAEVHRLTRAGLPPEDQVVLYRSHRLAEALKAALRAQGLAHHVRGAPSGLAPEDLDPTGEPEGGLTLSTIHQAKGLQWAAVFVIGLIEGGLPSGAALREPGGAEEERRLLYVACTRAKRRLYLSYPVTQGDRPALPSRFLGQLNPAELSAWPTSPERRSAGSTRS